LQTRRVERPFLPSNSSEGTCIPMSQDSANTVDFSGLDMELDEYFNVEDMETQQQQPQMQKQQQLWTPEQKTLIDEHRVFYQKMGVVINEIEENGPTGKTPKLPKRPKQQLNKIYGRKKVRDEHMDSHQLHDYLRENFADINHAILRETFSNDLFTKVSNEQEILERLHSGLKQLKRQEAQTLLIYIVFGNFLILAKKWVEDEKKEGRINQSWAAWLKEKTGYSDDHARKLRRFAAVLFGYQQFFQVGLPLSFILAKLNDISAMLQVPEYNTFWKQPVVFVPTIQLQLSQEPEPQQPALVTPPQVQDTAPTHVDASTEDTSTKKNYQRSKGGRSVRNK